MIVLTHQIADIILRTESDILIPHLQENPFEQFRISEKDPDIFIRIRRLDPITKDMTDSNKKECKVFSSFIGFQKSWLDNPILQSPRVRARLHECRDKPDQVIFRITARGVMIHDFVKNELDIFYDPGLKNYFDGPLVAAGYRNLISSFLPNFNAAMIHGAGVMVNGFAALFLAPDEGGKTTVVRQPYFSPVLNDDQIILRNDGNVVFSHGTPFGPITSGPCGTRLDAIFLLDKGSCFTLNPVKLEDILNFLWDEHVHHRIFLPKNMKITLFEILSTACHQALTYRMSFQKEYVDWNMICKVMEDNCAGK